MNPPKFGIATDGAHSVKLRQTRYRGVDIATGKELFCEHIGNQTVNIGEFLGVVEAVKYIIANNYSPPIVYTDSTTAIAWFRAKQATSKKTLASLRRAEIFLKAYAVQIAGIDVRHWDSSLWGETPADFGEK